MEKLKLTSEIEIHIDKLFFLTIRLLLSDNLGNEPRWNYEPLSK